MPTPSEKEAIQVELGERDSALGKGKESYEVLKRKRYLEELRKAREKKLKRQEEREKRAKAKAIQQNVQTDDESEAEEVEDLDEEERKKREEEERVKAEEAKAKEKRKEDRKRKMEGLFYWFIFTIFGFFRCYSNYIVMFKNIKNRKKFCRGRGRV